MHKAKVERSPLAASCTAHPFEHVSVLLQSSSNGIQLIEQSFQSASLPAEEAAHFCKHVEGHNDELDLQSRFMLM
jgi:hypothetical protein